MYLIKYLVIQDCELDKINSNSIQDNGYPQDGSRQIEWGWYPVGGASSFDTLLTPNHLISNVIIGDVTIVTT